MRRRASTSLMAASSQIARRARCVRAAITPWHVRLPERLGGLRVVSTPALRGSETPRDSLDQAPEAVPLLPDANNSPPVAQALLCDALNAPRDARRGPMTPLRVPRDASAVRVTLFVTLQ